MSGIIDCEMHIGDEVFVHGYIDEIRNDTIIIRNVGGYFGTSRDEVFYYEEDEPQTNKDFKVTYTCSFTECDNFKNFGFGEKCIECKRKQSEAKHKDEPQTERSE